MSPQISTSTTVSEPRKASEVCCDGVVDGDLNFIAAAYRELRRIAARKLSNERLGHSWGSCDLVDEAYYKVRGLLRQCKDQPALIRVMCWAMRQVLVDHHRQKVSQKRGCYPAMVPLDHHAGLKVSERSQMVVALDAALDDLEKTNPLGAQIVELRFFLGHTLQETADILSLSPVEVDAEWLRARAWLRKNLKCGQK